MKTRLCLIFLISLFAVGIAKAQKDSTDKPGWIKQYLNWVLTDTGDVADPRLLIYPTVGYAPETNLELGFSGLYVYYANKDTANRLSEINAFAFYTLEQQYGLFLDHALYSDQDRWFYLGKIRYQSFPLLYYGIGPVAPVDYRARVDANFTTIKERVLRQIAPSLYLGAEFDLQSLSGVNFVQADDNPIEEPIGSEGSTNFGAGLGLVYDDRHNVLNVRHGNFAELAFLRYDAFWGSDYSFTTVISDNRIFRPVNKRDVLAVQLYGQFTMAGQAPFNQLSLMGGESLMRGYYLGRYRDDHMLAAQVEYRMLPFSFTKYFGASVFLGAGQVFNADRDLRLDNFLPAGGVGFKYNLFPQKDIFVRLDFAFTRDGNGIYFFIGEAF